jgi:hypothetical protein
MTHTNLNIISVFQKQGGASVGGKVVALTSGNVVAATCSNFVDLTSYKILAFA